MRILIASPKIESIQTGNQSTALQWAAILEALGHETTFSKSMAEGRADLLVALHASKSHEAILAFRRQHPNDPVILGLAGTDIYPEPNKVSTESMRLADALVVLQEKALDRIPADCRSKARVIVQSAQRQGDRVLKGTDPFVICVAGHLRDVKDPMRAAKAVRDLPADSKIRIEHAGAVLDAKYHDIIAAEESENPRYEYRGALSEEDLHDLMRRSQATVLSSIAEGGARVISESVVEGTPIIATRIDGVTGLLDDHYPGLFPVGDTVALAALLLQLERDAAFRAVLEKEVKRLAPRFEPELERARWRSLISELTDK